MNYFNTFIQIAPDYRFEWVLPGHGQKVHLPVDDMRQQIKRLAEPMREGRET
jgi:hypothetical protein